MFWSVNNRLLKHADNSHRGLTWNDTTVDSATNLRIHLLLIPTELMNDGVNITCSIYNYGTNPVTSNPVYLYIQGKYINMHTHTHTHIYIYVCMYIEVSSSVV